MFSREIRAPDTTIANVITVNGIFPGPAIRASKGDTMIVNVTNFLSEGEMLSLHFHGISQRGTPWSDGVAGVTNCPIYFGRNHVYEFKVEEAGIICTIALKEEKEAMGSSLWMITRVLRRKRLDTMMMNC